MVDRRPVATVPSACHHGTCRTSTNGLDHPAVRAWPAPLDTGSAVLPEELSTELGGDVEEDSTEVASGVAFAGLDGRSASDLPGCGEYVGLNGVTASTQRLVQHVRVTGAEAAMSTTHGDLDGAGYDVLLVEDDLQMARAVGLALQDAGMAVRHAPDGARVRAELERCEPDVVLLDLGLPDDDGLALCADVRTRTDVPIIIVTARDDSADVVAGLEAGADDYVSKPVVGSELAPGSGRCFAAPGVSPRTGGRR